VQSGTDSGRRAKDNETRSVVLRNLPVFVPLLALTLEPPAVR